MIGLPIVGEVLLYKGVPEPFLVKVLRIDGDADLHSEFPVQARRLSDGVTAWVHPRNLERRIEDQVETLHAPHGTTVVPVLLKGQRAKARQ